MQVRAVVLDFDGTIAGDQGALVNQNLIQAIRRLRKLGVKIILNTGRDLDYLIGPRGLTRPVDVDLFDAIITECGASVWYPGRPGPIPLTKLHSPEVVAELKRVKIPSEAIWTGHSMIATRREYAPRARRAIDRLNARRQKVGLPQILLEETINNSSATYLPPGVNKGTAMLRIVAGHFGIAPADTLGGGDGANDLPFLSLCGAAIVPRNANPRVKALPNAINVNADNADAIAMVLNQVARNGLRLDPPQPGCAVA